MGLEPSFFLGPKKKWRKTWIARRKIKLQLQANTQSVDNFVGQTLKTKYFRVTFKQKVLFGPKPLKYSIEFYYEFCEENDFKSYMDRFRIKNWI
jgi:hypothetical protein